MMGSLKGKSLSKLDSLLEQSFAMSFGIQISKGKYVDP